MLSFNLLLVAMMIWMGRAYLRRFNSDAVASLFSAGFFLLSLAFVYSFWLHPEVFMMASVMSCLFFAFHEPEPRRTATGPLTRLWARVSDPSLWPIYSGAAISTIPIPIIQVQETEFCQISC